jgi:hypothetical protein
MKTKSILTSAAALGLVLAWSTSSSLAWDNCGHKTVATIAWDQLTTAARAQIGSIFQTDPRGRHFVDAAVWPDDIKRFERNEPPKAPVNKPWHYVNIPYDATAAQLEAVVEKPGADPAHMNSANVVTGIRYYTAYLQSGQGDSRKKADALSFLIHYIGDVHQPLHTLEVKKPLPNYTRQPRETAGATVSLSMAARTICMPTGMTSSTSANRRAAGAMQMHGNWPQNWRRRFTPAPSA